MIAHRLAVLSLVGSVGCAVGQPTAMRTLDPSLEVGRLAARTSFEQPATASATDLPDLPTKPGEADGNDRAQRARRGVFVAGAVLTGLGAGTTLAFGVAGRVVQFQLKKAYEDGVTHAHESYLRRHGAAYNKVAIAGASIGVVGVVMMVVAAGLDYTRCGNLTQKKHKDCRPR